MGYVGFEANIEQLFRRYLAERHLFVSTEDIFTDARKHLNAVCKGHKMGSKKWKAKAIKARFWRHYKMRRTFVTGSYPVHKKYIDFKFSACHVFPDQRGTVYCLLQASQERLFFFSAHFFDRVTQRNLGYTGEQVQRSRAIQEGIEFFTKGQEILDGRDPLLLDYNGEAYYVMDGGYAVGNHITIPVSEKDFPENKTGNITICFFKTFFSDLEISPEQMERMLDLYRINGFIDRAFNQSY